MTTTDYLLVCNACHTHWFPKTYTRKNVREGHCPDCGYKGKPFTGDYYREHWKNGRPITHKEPKKLGRFGGDKEERCPYHGDPVFADPDSILIQREPFYIHYDNVGATGLNEHINNPGFLDNIRKWYASRGLGVRLVKKSGAGCPYYAVYVGTKPRR